MNYFLFKFFSKKFAQFNAFDNLRFALFFQIFFRFDVFDLDNLFLGVAI